MRKRRGGRSVMTPKKESPPGMVWGFLGAEELPDGRVIKRWGWIAAERLHEVCKKRMENFDSMPSWRREQERGS